MKRLAKCVPVGLGALLALTVAFHAGAGTAADAARLGSELTPFGGEKAANTDRKFNRMRPSMARVLGL
ncbi:MAG TPA: hypothetical protein PLN82_11725, partial [Rhodoferax sp.]|nr:hypothetical protein [Rhodoferax sp.]